MNKKEIRKAVLREYDYEWIKEYDFEVEELVDLAIEKTIEEMKKVRFVDGSEQK